MTRPRSTSRSSFIAVVGKAADLFKERFEWVYAVYFKKPRDGRLYWILTQSQDEREASRAARTAMTRLDPKERYLEYGLIKQKLAYGTSDDGVFIDHHTAKSMVDDGYTVVWPTWVQG